MTRWIRGNAVLAALEASKLRRAEAAAIAEEDSLARQDEDRTLAAHRIDAMAERERYDMARKQRVNYHE